VCVCVRALPLEPNQNAGQTEMQFLALDLLAGAHWDHAETHHALRGHQCLRAGWRYISIEAGPGRLGQAIHPKHKWISTMALFVSLKFCLYWNVVREKHFIRWKVLPKDVCFHTFILVQSTWTMTGFISWVTLPCLEFHPSSMHFSTSPAWFTFKFGKLKGEECISIPDSVTCCSIPTIGFTSRKRILSEQLSHSKKRKKKKIWLVLISASKWLALWLHL